MITLNWGILGAGNISGQFVHDLLLNNQENSEIKHIVRSIGCSSDSKGVQFISDNKVVKESNEGIEPVIQRYDDFYKNKDIDIVYVGTPHVFHKEQVTQCLNNDLHVLCEKPMTINAKESQQIIDLAKSKKKFLMEAVWTRFLPIVDQLRSKINDEKIIGDVYRFSMDFSFDGDIANCPPESRIRNKHLGAGALLDIGIYCITYARILLDDKLGKDHTPFDMKSLVEVDPVDKVDYNTSMLMKYKTGKIGVLSCSNHMDSFGPYARIDGTKGFIEMYAENPARLRSFKIRLKSGEQFEVRDDGPYNGFIYEANAVAKDIDAGRLESSVVPHDETLLVMGVMDQVRKDNEFTYPME